MRSYEDKNPKKDIANVLENTRCGCKKHPKKDDKKDHKKDHEKCDKKHDRKKGDIKIFIENLLASGSVPIGTTIKPCKDKHSGKHGCKKFLCFKDGKKIEIFIKNTLIAGNAALDKDGKRFDD